MVSALESAAMEDDEGACAAQMVDIVRAGVRLRPSTQRQCLNRNMAHLYVLILKYDLTCHLSSANLTSV